MGKYVVKRLLHGLFSVICVVLLVMVLIYSLMDRTKIFASDGSYTKQSNNAKVTYQYSRWEQYGYLDYVTYSEYLGSLVSAGELDEADRTGLSSLGRSADKDSAEVAEYTARFRQAYESQGYTVIRLDAATSRSGKLLAGGQPALFAYRDTPLISRALKYFADLFEVDNVHSVPADQDVGERKLTFTLYDPVYNPVGSTEKVFAPAIMGNGTQHKYLLYFDGQFPYIHQNLLTINLGTSFTVTQGVDVFTSMTRSQGAYVLSTLTFPTGLTEQSADDLHTATYVAGSRDINALNRDRFTDDYTSVDTFKTGFSKLGYSFIIGILSVIMSYVLGLPIGLLMAQYKDKIIDKLGTIYIVFIIAVPSLAYIFLFKAVGGAVFKLPTTFDTNSASKLMYILPIVSLALPSIASLMKWMRRYMIDQQNSDYVKFARSGGLSETEIFTKHIWKNAMIPLVHGIPASVIFAMTGAIITERVYVVPGAGNLLTQAINAYDNGVIVGVTLFYAVLSVIAIILGDVLMATVDPRISFTTKDR